jgi:BirA family transcriptional regulator, biotin operon repressor / biotin---[acetyl-CoA-carboxylase] ligase
MDAALGRPACGVATMARMTRMPASRRPLDTARVQEQLAPVMRGGIVLLDTAGSTNTVLRERLRDQDWTGPVLLSAEHQQAGRGRAGHDWQTPAGAALTVSIAVRPARPRDTWGWLPLLTGVAVCRAIEQVAGLAPALKWPNDVLVPDPERRPAPGWGGHRKAVGILTEAVGDLVIAGIGINVDQSPAELPVPHAVSLRAAGAGVVDRTALLIAVAREVVALTGAPRSAATEDEVRDRCLTLGTDIEADLPDGGRLTGRAESIDADGSLRVRGPDGSLRTLSAGDLRHVRPRGELGSGE